VFKDIRGQCQGPWLVVGDFNMIYKDEGKKNSNLNRPMIGRFRRFNNDVVVKKMSLIGCKFTSSCSFSSSSPTLVKVDHVFCTVDWEDHFTNSLLQSAVSVDSDHCPLILALRGGCPGMRKFHFEVFWLKFDGFQQAVQQAWEAVQTKTCPIETIALKFKVVGRALQSWSDKKLKISDHNSSWQSKFCTYWKSHRTAGLFPFLRFGCATP
jgi:hypothetical protein